MTPTTKRAEEPVRMAAALSDAAAELAGYVGTYKGAEHLGSRCYLDDMLYGIAISMDRERYQFANGFRQFKRDLLIHLKTTPGLMD